MRWHESPTKLHSVQPTLETYDADSWHFSSRRLPDIITCMEILRLILQSVFEWLREVVAGVFGRCVEEFVGSRLKRGSRKRKRKTHVRR